MKLIKLAGAAKMHDKKKIPFFFVASCCDFYSSSALIELCMSIRRVSIVFLKQTEGTLPKQNF